MPLVADGTVCNEQFTQLVCGAIEHHTIGKGLVHLQMSLSAMSLVDDVKDVKHVGVVQAWVDQKLVKCDILRVFLMSNSVVFTLFFTQVTHCISQVLYCFLTV